MLAVSRTCSVIRPYTLLSRQLQTSAAVHRLPFTGAEALEKLEKEQPGPVCRHAFKKKRERKKKSIKKEDPMMEHNIRIWKSAFEENRMLAVLIFMDAKAHDWDVLRNNFFDNDIKCRVVTRKPIMKYLKRSPFNRIKALLDGPSAIAWSKDVKVKELLASMKGVEHIHLAGASVDRRFFSRKGFSDIAKMPPIDRLQAEVVGILAGPAVRLQSAICSPAQSLVANLQQYVKQNS